MLRLATSRSGEKIAIIKDTYLHSRFDPVREAERFVREQLRDEPPAAIILMGAGLGHMIGAAQRRFPAARVIPIFYSQEIPPHCSPLPARHWHPGHPLPLLSFLRQEIPELDSEGLSVLEWPASAHLFPHISASTHQAINQLLKEHRGSLLTTHAFGKRWIKNTFINFVAIGSPLQPCSTPFPGPILIAASGPSLERAATLLHDHRRRVLLMALPSSLPFLLDQGLEPDLIVMTDPGYYAMYHLHSAAGRTLGRTLKVAMPPSAATGSWRIPADIWFIAQANFLESDLLSRAGLKAPVIPPHGTVTATAMELALTLNQGKVIFAGLDLCYQDLKSHVRPNSFEPLLHQVSNRLQPLRSLMYARATVLAPEIIPRQGQTIRSGPALATYAGWFSSLNERLTARVMRLNPSPIELPGMPNIDLPTLEQYLGDASVSSPPLAFTEHPHYPTAHRRADIAGNLLAHWESRVDCVLADLSRGHTLQPFLADSFQLSLAYYFAPLVLTKIKKTQRLKTEREAIAQATRLLEEERLFLRVLKERIPRVGK